jgi:hypothetical protein
MRIVRLPAAPAATLGVIVSLALVALTGCGPGGPALYPVAGKVTLKDGTPIAYGHVILHPDVKQGNESMEVCQGTINDGNYTIMTGAREGAPLGAYTVAIEAAKDVDPNNPYFTEWLAHEKYIDPTQSNLTLEVVEDPQPGRYDFKLDPHPQQKTAAQ